jgi:hypothetical protein
VGVWHICVSQDGLKVGVSEGLYANRCDEVGSFRPQIQHGSQQFQQVACLHSLIGVGGLLGRTNRVITRPASGLAGSGIRPALIANPTQLDVGEG